MTAITLPRQVGLAVSHARKRRGLTQQQVADRSGVSRQLVNRVEAGTSPGIALVKLMSILDAVGCQLTIVDKKYDEKNDLEAQVAQGSPYVVTPRDPSLIYPFDDTLLLEPMQEGAPYVT